MQQIQREMFSKGLIDVGTLCLAALVFGQLASGGVVHRGQMGLGVALWIVLSIGAFSMSLDRGKLIDKK
jgi:hypothetical protein